MLEAFFTTLAGLFLFGTFSFWVFVILVALVIAAEVHFDKGTPATVTLVGTVVFLHFFSGVNVLQFAYQNIFWFVGGAVLYLLTGAAWSLTKLAIHTKNLGDKYRREQVQFLRNHKLDDDTDFKALNPELKKEWQETLNYYLFDFDPRNGSVTFDLHKRRSTVIMWIGHWPFSFLGTVLNEPVKHAINFLYNRLVGLYERIIAKNLGYTKGHVLTHAEVKSVGEARPNRSRGY